MINEAKESEREVKFLVKNQYSVGQEENFYHLLCRQAQLAKSLAAEKSFESIVVADIESIQLQTVVTFNKLK